MIFFVFLLGFFGIFGAARWVMFAGLQQCALPTKLKARAALTGAARECALLCLIFVLCFNLRLALLPLGGAALASALMTASVVVTVFFNLVDAAIYREAARRLDKAVLANTNLISILAVFHCKEFLITLGVLSFLGVLGFAVWQGMEALQAAQSWMPALALILALGMWLKASKVHMDKEDFIPYLSHELDWVNMKIGLFMADDVEVIMRSAPWCFAEIFLKKQGMATIEVGELNGEEEQILKKAGLLEAPAPKRPEFTPHLYKRIVVIEVESLARNLLPMYNAKIPKETTPFLSFVHRKYARFDNYYATSSPTELALMAMLGSRLRDSWEYEDTGVETFFSVLRKRDYHTYFIQCTTGHYNNHHKKNPAVLKPQTFIADDELKKEFPNDERNTWGFGDATLFKKALNLLEQHRDDPVCVFVSTVNTHAPFWYSYTKFPPSVESTQYQVLRSLYQLDCELAEFFAGLRERALFDDDTLFIITADHNPHFGDEYPELTGESYYPNLIPLYALTTKPSPWSSIPHNMLACQLDFLPTFCEASGIPVPATALGDSMFNVRNRRIILQQTHPTRVDVSAYGLHFSVDSTETPKTPTERAYQKWLIHKLKAAGMA